MVSQTEADPGYPPGLVPCLGRLPDGEIFAALVYLENINRILPFIINIISQPIEHLNISSAFIVRLIRKCTWYFLTQ